MAEIQAMSRTESLRMLKEFQRQSLAEMFNTMLVRGKNQLRGETTIIFTESLMNLQSQIDDITIEYFDKVIENQERIALVKDQGIRERMERMQIRRMDEFEEAVDKLMEDFKNIISDMLECNTYILSLLRNTKQVLS